MAIRKGHNGFSLIELLVATAILAIVIMMTSDIFTIVVAQSGQQTKVASTGMDSVIGLRLLRYDIEHAGYGLPERFQNTIAYSEAASTPASTYNDSPAAVPRGIITGNNTGFNGSDYLVIKSTAAGTTETAQKWDYITQGAQPTGKLTSTNRVIVLKPKSDEISQNELIMNGSAFFTQYSSSSFPSAFSPTRTAETFIIYGVDPDTDLRMPFNRTDYYISRVAGDTSPSCAPNTGVLYKATVNHDDGQLDTMPVMDCVADMQVIFRRDTNADGVADASTNNLSSLTAQQIRETVQEVRVYILAQEGQRDKSYTHSPAAVSVGEFGLGSTFNLATTIGTGWQNYRWKVYTLVIRTKQYNTKGS